MPICFSVYLSALQVKSIRKVAKRCDLKIAPPISEDLTNDIFLPATSIFVDLAKDRRAFHDHDTRTPVLWRCFIGEENILCK